MCLAFSTFQSLKGRWKSYLTHNSAKSKMWVFFLCLSPHVTHTWNYVNLRYFASNNNLMFDLLNNCWRQIFLFYKMSQDAFLENKRHVAIYSYEWIGKNLRFCQLVLMHGLKYDMLQNTMISMLSKRHGYIDIWFVTSRQKFTFIFHLKYWIKAH